MIYKLLLTTGFIFFFLISCSFISTNALQMNFKAVHFLNPNVFEQPSPVIVNVYQLRSAERFRESNFLVLMTQAEKILALDELEHIEVEIKPGENIKKNWLIHPEAQAIGIVAAYRNPSGNFWKKVIPLKDLSYKKINILLGSEALELNIPRLINE